MFQKSSVRIPAPYTGWRFSHLLVVKALFEKMKRNEKEAGDGPFKKLKCLYLRSSLNSDEFYSVLLSERDFKTPDLELKAVTKTPQL